MVAIRKKLTIMILEDEEDILVLYSDYLTKQGHHVLNTYVNSDIMLEDIEIERPDIYLIDYLLPGNKNGVEVASEILKKFPTSCIMFITGFELLSDEISKHDIFYGKNMDILIKPVRLGQLQDSLVNLLSTKEQIDMPL